MIERKQASLPAFVVVPAAQLASWKLAGTTVVEATLDGVALGRRSLRRWDEQRWFLELRAEHLRALGKRPGARAALELRRVADELPAELERLLATEPAARAAWEARTDAQRRMLREHVLEAKGAATRERRARGALLPAPAPATARVRGLGAEPRRVLVRIEAERLPGSRCGEHAEVTVHLARKEPRREDVVPGDARTARWETEVALSERDGAPAFRGEAVNGPPRERFLYLVWSGRRGHARAMFRRAKLRLDAVPADVLAQALASGVLVARLGLTAADGSPACASLRPPLVRWTSG